MKTLKHTLGTLLVATLLLTSCKSNNDDDVFVEVPATQQEFNALKQKAIDNLKQTFEFDTDDGNVTFTSEKGVQFDINISCLILDGNPVTGNIDVEFVELFEKGNMLITNKTTMGIMPNGDRAMLLSGGEFFIEVTKDGEEIETNCGVNMRIPTALSGGDDFEMLLWKGNEDADGNVEWEEERDANGNAGKVFIEGGAQGGGNQYYALFGGFGWSNVDKFYSDARPKTTILVQVPEGYDNENSAVYLSYDGEDGGLANLDTYDAEMELFSEHYGQIPIGLECHVIFATEQDDQWKYAIKGVTIVDGGTIVITDGETSLADEATLTTIIDSLP